MRMWRDVCCVIVWEIISLGCFNPLLLNINLAVLNGLL